MKNGNYIVDGYFFSERTAKMYCSNLKENYNENPSVKCPDGTVMNASDIWEL